MSHQQNFAAGWYKDPQYPDFERYWDGIRWTDQTRPIADPSAEDQWTAAVQPVVAVEAEATLSSKQDTTIQPAVGASGTELDSIEDSGVFEKEPADPRALESQTASLGSHYFSNSPSGAATSPLAGATSAPDAPPASLGTLSPQTQAATSLYAPSRAAEQQPHASAPAQTKHRSFWQMKRFLIPAGGITALCLLVLGAAAGSVSPSSGSSDDDIPEALAMSDAATAHLDSLSYDVEVSGTPERPYWITALKVSAPDGYWESQNVAGHACQILDEDALSLSNELGAPLMFRLSNDEVTNAMTSFSRTGSAIVNGRCEVTVAALGSVEELTEMMIFSSDELFVEFDGESFFSGQTGEPRLKSFIIREIVQEAESTTTTLEETTTTEAPTTTKAIPTPTAATQQTAPSAEGPATAAAYANCSEVQAAGKAPIRIGDPGYSSDIDRDGDGIACE